LKDDLGFSFKTTLTTIPAECMSEIDFMRISKCWVCRVSTASGCAKRDFQSPTMLRIIIWLISLSRYITESR
jgi:hypothetical protein